MSYLRSVAVQVFLLTVPHIACIKLTSVMSRAAKADLNLT